MRLYQIFRFEVVYDFEGNQLIKFLITQRYLKSALKRKLLETGVDYNQYYFDGQLKIFLKVEDGSVKGVVAFFGTVLTIVQVIASYSDLKSSLSEIYQDSRQVVEYFQEDAELLEKRNNSTEIITIKKSFGLIEELKITLSRLEYLHEHYDELSPNEVKNEISKTKLRLSSLIECMDKIEKEHILEFLPQEWGELPPPNSSMVYTFKRLYGLREEDLIYIVNDE